MRSIGRGQGKVKLKTRQVVVMLMAMVQIILKPQLNTNTGLSKRMPPNRSIPAKKRRRSKLKRVRMLKALSKLLPQVKQNRK
jgi:hypothetical protein